MHYTSPTTITAANHVMIINGSLTLKIVLNIHFSQRILTARLAPAPPPARDEHTTNNRTSVNE
jgi:hypothetical protein